MPSSRSAARTWCSDHQRAGGWRLNEELLVEVWWGLGESTDGLIRKAAEQRANRLTHAEFEREATWATRKYVPFVMQRISVAVQIAAATEIRQALGRGMGPDSA